ncbi:MAG: hypothetical protein ACOCSE_01870, partial [Chitinivibrionales bacterium]
DEADAGEADADEADAGEADADEADAGEADADEADAGEATAGEADADEDKEGEEGFEADKPTGGISAGMVTVDGEQWTRIALFADIPIWRFGIGLDLELFLDQQGAPSSKGWSFSKDNWAEAVFRKIRYLRFNHEGDPVYIRFGGLESVTLGYGIIMKEFTNMLYYPDEKLLGLRFDLNDISPLGISIQTVIADFHDFNNESGILGGRLGFKPFKPSGVPLLENLEIAGMGVLDVNQYGPARDWDYSLEGSKYDRDQDGITDSAFTTSLFDTIDHTLSAEEKNRLREADLFDTNIEHKDRWASRSHNSFSIVGGDGSLPLIQSKIFDLTLYGQAAIIYDKLFEDKDKRDRGWGVGAPGLLAGIGPLNLQVEYRHTDGHFHFSYFDKYYLAERITRNPEVVIKEDRLSYNDLNGVYGEAGMDIAGIFHLRANYQYLFGDSITRDYYFQDTIRDVPLKDTEQKLEATASIGQKVIERIPKLNRAEIFFDKTNIQNTVIKYGKEENQDGGGFLYTLTYDGLFDKTRFMHWGYRIGIEMTEGTSITWETRHGWKRPEDIKPGEKIELIEDNSISIQAGMSF